MISHGAPGFDFGQPASAPFFYFKKGETPLRRGLGVETYFSTNLKLIVLPEEPFQNRLLGHLKTNLSELRCP